MLVVLRFGRELSCWRAKAGLPQRSLAERTHHSPHTIAAVERGRRYPSEELARRCDDVLATDGALTDLWPAVAQAQIAADRRRRIANAGESADRVKLARAMRIVSMALRHGRITLDDLVLIDDVQKGVYHDRVV